MASKKIFDIVFKTSGIGKAQSGVKSLGGSLFSMSKKLVLVGGGLAAVSVKLAGDFSKSLREVGTLMGGVTDNELKNMSKELRVLAQSSGLALSSLSKAKYDVVSAGFASAAGSAKILATTSRLAVGGVTSAANAADILTTALNAYGLTASSVDDVSDILFTTVRFGKTTMDELSASLGTVLPFARGAGLALADVGAVMASLTAGGIGTAEATTALRGALVALASPADGARKAMEEAGIEVIKFNDGTMDILETVRQFEGMDPAAIRKFIPDVRAQLAISALGQNLDGLASNLQNFTKRSGATEDAFTQMMKEFNNQMSVMRNTSQSIMIEVGQIIIDAILPSITRANEAMQKLGEIGWDVVASRIMEGSGHIRLILSDVMDIIGQEIYIGGQKALGFLPRLLGGISDKEMENNIAVAQQMIRMHMRTMMVEVEAFNKKVTAPGPEQFGVEQMDWTEFMPEISDDVWDDLIPAEDQLTPINDLAVSYDLAAKAALRLKQAEELKNKEMKEASIAAFEEVAVAAALNADSAEDAAERVVRAMFMEALAKQVSKIISTVPFPFNIGVAAGAAGLLTGLFDQGMSQIKKLSIAQFGMDEVVSSPTLVLAGEAGPERIQVTPQGRAGAGGSDGGVTINFLGPVTSKDFVRDTIIPEFQRASKLGLA